MKCHASTALTSFPLQYKCDYCSQVWREGNYPKECLVKRVSNDPWDNLKTGDKITCNGKESFAEIIEVLENSVSATWNTGIFWLTKKELRTGWTIKDSTPKEEPINLNWKGSVATTYQEPTADEIISEVIRIIDSTSIPATVGTGEAIIGIKEKIKQLLSRS